MAKGRKGHDRKKQERLDLRRRLEKRQKGKPTPLAWQIPAGLGDKLRAIHDLIRVRKFAEAEQLLDQLGEQYERYPAFVEAQVLLFQTTEDHQRCCQAAERLMKLTPRDPDACLLYAQESMFCGRIGIAFSNYQRFLQLWPDHANAAKAMAALEFIGPECEKTIRSMGFDDQGLALLVIHEEVLECLQNLHFKGAAEKCLELLKRAPGCFAARNNLAIAYFQSGNIDKALRLVEETCRLAPENRFAEATLGRIKFLNGQEDEANAIADQIVANPPAEQDPLAAAIELLSFLGRDENIVVLSGAALDRGIVDPRCRAVVLHHLAVAQYRLGDEKAARSSWKECLREMPTHAEARGNLDDLDSGSGHAPWAESIFKWIPRAVCKKMLRRGSEGGKTEDLDLATNFPAVAALIPALLDRGDPIGREMARRLAAADGSPAMLDALQQFALGTRGPDAMRYEALTMLGKRGRVDSGPHRFYSRGKWIEMKLVTTEINWQATTCASPYVQELVERGTEALSNGDFALAEQSFQRILDKEPDNCCAAYNLCLVWLERDGEAGRRRAQARLEEIHARFPDYVFATISLAQFAAMDGDVDRALQLLEPLVDAKELHVSEAIALFAAHVQIAVKRRDLDSAEQSLALLAEFAGEDDPRVVKLRRLIDTTLHRREFRRLPQRG